jgi:hypothetical protein
MTQIYQRSPSKIHVGEIDFSRKFFANRLRNVRVGIDDTNGGAASPPRILAKNKI